MDKEFNFLAEAYEKVLNSPKTVNEGEDQNKDGKKDFKDVQIARMVASGMSKEEAIAKVEGKKKSKKEDEEKLKEAYEMVLEFKHINKKFARRYNKVTAAMLKAEPGSEEYSKLKAEREDLVTILKDHGQTPKDLEAFLIKKEKENPLPEVPENQDTNQYSDNSYSDTSEYTDNTIKVDFTQDQNTDSAQTAQAAEPELQAAAAQ